MKFRQGYSVRNTLLTAAAAILSIPSAIAADYLVCGRVTGLADNEPCPGASYRIFLSADSVTPVVFNVTNDDGAFRQILKSSGNYILKVEYLGMKSDIRNFQLTPAQPTLDLGNIALSPDDETLDEVVVIAKKKLIESDGATLTYNVEEDPESSINSTMEMLRKVPMVTVDAEDNIRVNGNSNFRILVNGKEDPMLSGDVKTILKSMPAATIKKIEVITEPGAKYDAEGTGGILNIITTGKQSLEGYLANISANVSNQNYGASAYGRLKLGQVTTSANVNYADAFDLGYINSNKSVLENLTNDENRYQTTEGKSKMLFNYLGANFNLSWEPDTLNLFTVQGNVGKSDFKSNSIQNMRLENISMQKIWSLNRDSYSKNNNLWLGANASFQHTFKRQGHHIVGSYIFGYNNGDNNSYTETTDMDNIVEEFPWRLDASDSYGRRHSLQMDYANPLTKKHLIEIGVKGNWNNSYQNSSPWYGINKDDLYVRESERVNMKQFQDITAAYASYGGTYGKWNIKAGIRYEHTRMGLEYFIGNYDNFTTHLNDVAPNAAISFKMADASNLRLAYQMRIRRPGLGNMNPYRNTMTPNVVTYGNPDLESEKSHGVTLTYTNYGGKLGGTFAVSYRREDNAISDYQFFEDNVLNQTYANIGHAQHTNANLNVNWNIITMLNLGVNLSGGYNDYKANSPQLTAANSNWQGNFNVNVDYTFPFMLRLSAYGGGGSGWSDLQSKSSGWSFYGLSLSRSFLKEKALTISAFGSNFLQPYRNYSFSQISETSISRSTSRVRQWRVGVSISLRLGSLRSDVKRTGAELEMEQGDSSAPSQTGGSPM